MRKLYSALLVLCSFNCFPQSYIDSYNLQVCMNKTTNLIFPFSIKSVDRGSKDILVQKTKGNENVLLVKAGRENFGITNLSVITADGKLYSFIVHYSSDPPQLNISFNGDSTKAQPSFLNKSVRDEQMKLTLRSIYIDKQTLWFHFDIQNYSLIDFKPGYIKFFIQDKQKPKRTAEQLTELIPVYQITKPVIPGRNKQAFAFAFPQFTLPKDKRMVCEISEQNGGRLLVLYIGHKALLRARAPLP
jgi:hypothetical protein